MGNVRHVTAGKMRGDLFVQLYGRSTLIAPSNGTVAQCSCDVQYWENIQLVLYGHVYFLPSLMYGLMVTFQGKWGSSSCPCRPASNGHAHVQSLRMWHTLTCTPMNQLLCRLLSFYVIIPLCIHYCCGTTLILVLRSFADFHKCQMKCAVSVKQIAIA